MLARSLGGRARAVLGLATGVAFIAISVANLAYPESRGPADQGDFSRIVADFSSGPVGFALWPDESDPSHRLRFSTTHHRFWRFDAQGSWRSHLSSSKLVFFPERFLRSPWAAPLYDLTCNTVLVMTVLGIALAATIATLTGVVPAVTLVGLALMLSDLRISWYVNSFYQEAGTYVFVVSALCLLFAWMQRQSLLLLGLAFVALTLLATSKVAFGPSVLLIVAGVVVVALVRVWQRRRHVLLVLTGAAVTVLAAGVHGQLVRHAFEREVGYDFVFTSALPELTEPEQRSFLQTLGLPAGLVRLSGKSIYERTTDPIDPAQKELFDNRLHGRAVWLLATGYPRAFLRVLAGAVSESGSYDLTPGGYGYRELDASPTEATRIDLWSRWRGRFLGGRIGYLLVLLLLGTIAARAIVAGGTAWLTFFAVLSVAFVLASLAQVAIAVLGDGRVDLLKHLYFANLCCDVALVLALGGVAQAYATPAGSAF